MGLPEVFEKKKGFSFRRAFSSEESCFEVLGNTKERILGFQIPKEAQFRSDTSCKENRIQITVAEEVDKEEAATTMDEGVTITIITTTIAAVAGNPVCIVSTCL